MSRNKNSYISRRYDRRKASSNSCVGLTVYIFVNVNVGYVYFVVKSGDDYQAGNHDRGLCPFSYSLSFP